MALSRRHKALADIYLDINNMNTFMNKTASYNTLYRGKNQGNAHRVFEREDIKTYIDARVEAMVNLSKDDYLVKLEAELQKCKQEGARVRLLELIGKSLNHLKDKEIHTTINNVDIKDIRKELDKRKSLLET